MTELKEFSLEKVLDKTQQDTLESLSRRVVQIDQKVAEGQSAYQNFVTRMEAPLGEANRALAPIDTAVGLTEQLRKEVATLTSGLNAKFAELGIVFDGAQTSVGLMEKIYERLGNTEKLASLQMRRLEQQTVEKNFQQILAYGALVIKKYGEIAIVLAKNEKVVEAAINDTNKRIEEIQPQYDGWRAKRLGIEDELRLQEEKANSGENSPEFLRGLETMRREFTHAKEQENMFYAVLDKNRVAFPYQSRQREVIQSNRANIEQMRAGVKEEIEKVTSIYNTTMDNMRAALVVKSGQEFSSTNKTALEAAMQANVWSQKGIADVVARDALTPTMTPEKIAYLTDVMRRTNDEFVSKMEQAKATTAAYHQA